MGEEGETKTFLGVRFMETLIYFYIGWLSLLKKFFLFEIFFSQFQNFINSTIEEISIRD